MRIFSWLFPPPPPPPQIVVSKDCIARWLHAQRPPWDAFVRMSIEEQQVFSDQGAAFAAERVIDLLKGLRDPELFEAEAFPDEPASKKLMMQRAAAEMVAQMGDAQMPAVEPVVPEPLSMVGALDRAEKADQERRDSSQRRIRFLGQNPTAVKVPEELENEGMEEQTG